MRNLHKILIEIPKRSRPLYRPGFKVEDEVKSDLLKMEYDSVVCGGIVLLKQAVLY
jgi:hypothetical protein